jgi:hypothetical protein
MERGRPDDGARREAVYAPYGAQGLGVRGLKNAYQSFPIRRQIAAEWLDPVEIEALHRPGHLLQLFRGQTFGKLALEDD